MLGVSHTHIWHALNGTRKPISVNLLVKYAATAHRLQGVGLHLTISPTGELQHRLVCATVPAQEASK
jgi:hypothetical protein